MRVALVTGSSRGIGKATAIRLADTHDAVVVHYRRDKAGAEETAAEIERRGKKVLVAAAELEDGEALTAMIDMVSETFGALDTLVSNAAAGKFAALDEHSDVNYERTFNTIVLGFLRLVRLGVPLMPEGGRIIAVSGLDSYFATPLHGAIGAMKASLEALVRQLSFELAKKGILVNAVVPGGVSTDSANYQISKMPGLAEHVWSTTPLGRFGEPEEIASVIHFLASPDSSFVTGQSIIVDGGVTAGGGPWGGMILTPPQPPSA